VTATSAGATAGFERVDVSLSDPEWSKLVARRDEAGPFHLAAWSQLLADCYGFRAFGLGLRKDGELVAGAPFLDVRTPVGGRTWRSLPFTDSCSLLGDTADLPVLRTAIDDARRDAGVTSSELRSDVPGGGSVPVAYHHVLSLVGGEEAVHSRFKVKRVTQILRRLEQDANGLIVREAENARDLTEIFYRLHVANRRRLGVPVQPRRFFRLLWERMIEPGHGYVLLAFKGATPVAGMVFLTGGSVVIYKYGASDAAYQRLRPNHALLWAAIRRATSEGYASFDFGRTDFDNEGLRDFKLGWGTAEEQLSYTYLGTHKGAGAGRGTASRALAVAIRRSPPAFCRATGEILYRYAA
jgi:CelD/BcsL family acetyltransferase involved in cellulose biosynthesis